MPVGYMIDHKDFEKRIEWEWKTMRCVKAFERRAWWAVVYFEANKSLPWECAQLRSENYNSF